MVSELMPICFQPNTYYDIESDSFKIVSSSNVKKPLTFAIRINRYCNLNCIYCLSDSSSFKSSSANMLENILSKMITWYPARVVWCGGEPTLVKKLYDFASFLKRNGCVNVVATNGLKKPNEKLLEIVDWWDVSLHGISQQNYFYNTGVDGFLKVYENINFLLDAKARVSCNIVLQKTNLNDYLQFFRKLCQLRISKLRLARLLPLGRGMSLMRDDPTDNELKNLIKDLEKERFSIPIVYPAIKKRFLSNLGYFVIENDGKLSSPLTLEGLQVYHACKHKQWPSAIQAHVDLFSGIKD